MPAGLAYGDLLKRAHMEEMGRALGLNDPSAFEAYIMNFEIHKMLGSALGGCVHGGMAVPFHLEALQQRLSRDVDLYVFEDIASVERRMSMLASSLRGRGVNIERYVPLPNAPLRCHS